MFFFASKKLEKTIVEKYVSGGLSPAGFKKMEFLKKKEKNFVKKCTKF